MNRDILLERKVKAISEITRDANILAERFGLKAPTPPSRKDSIDGEHYELALIEFVSVILLALVAERVVEQDD